MNATMKLALGVTGFSSLLVLAVPSNFDVSKDKNEENTSVSEAILDDEEQRIEEQELEEQELVEPKPQVVVEDYREEEGFSFGDPTTNPEPIDHDDFDDYSKFENSNDLNREETTQIRATPQVRITPNDDFQPDSDDSAEATAAALQALQGQFANSPSNQSSGYSGSANGQNQTFGTNGNPDNNAENFSYQYGDE